MSLRLVDSIERNAKHYIDVLSQAVDKVMPKETKEITYEMPFGFYGMTKGWQIQG